MISKSTKSLSHPSNTLYYDGNCSLCRYEIDKLKCGSNTDLEFQDIRQLDCFNGIPDKGKLLSRLHMRTSNDQWLTGLEANIAAWQLSGNESLARIISHPLIKPLAKTGYSVWLLLYKQFNK